MKRKNFTKRENYKEINESLGFDFQSLDNNKEYWAEDTGYEFALSEVEKIEKATNEVHQMCFSAIDYVIKNNRFKDFGIDQKMVPYIKKTWEREDWSMFGRFDFCFDGKKLKVFEYNADTPTSLVEAALAQWQWKDGQKLPDQFNSLDPKLVDWWKDYRKEFNPNKVYFTTVKENVEDFRNTEYIMDCATRAGIETDFLFIEDLGSDGEFFYDLQNNKIEHLFKLYPWEWLANEQFIDTVLQDNCKIIEPAWKMILSNKALMAILWELFPNHEYLLPTYFSEDKLKSSFVKKPLLSREGQNVSIVEKNNTKEEKEGLYRSDLNIYQEICYLPEFQGNYPVIGSWVVGEESAGMGIREDKSKITANLSRFVPHYFVKQTSATPFPSSRGGSRPLEETKKTLQVKWENAIFPLFALFILSFLYFKDKSIQEQNIDTLKYNETQKPYFNDLFKKDHFDKIDNWIDSKIEEKNREVFKKFIASYKDLVIYGLKGEKENFYEADQKMMMSVYCIQGQKDIELFKDLSENLLLENDQLNKALNYAKNKMNYSNRKISLPNEEEVLNFCNFKNFDKDLKQNIEEYNKTSKEKIQIKKEDEDWE